MFSKAVKCIKENQPIGTTGIMLHIANWLTSCPGGYCYENSRFKPDFGKGVTLCCIPGTADYPGAFKPFITKTKPYLPPYISRILVPELEGWGGSIEYYAWQLKEKLRQANAEYVILVGHSRGGLVGCEFAVSLAEEIGVKVISIITIGTPFFGTGLAKVPPLSRFACSVEQMKINSDYLTKLRNQIVQKKLTYLNIAIKEDWIVPAKSAVLKKEGEELGDIFMLDRHGHITSMLSNRMIVVVLEFIKKTIHERKAIFTDLNSFVTPYSEFCAELWAEICRLEKSWHIWSCSEKIKVLKDLLDCFDKHEIDNHYQVNTIGEFIEYYLQDNQRFGIKPITILSTHLNSCVFNLFGTTMPSSLEFINNLKAKYQNIKITSLSPNCNINFAK